MNAPDHKAVNEAVDRVDDVKLRVNLQAVLTASNIGHVLALHELYEQQSTELEKLRQRCEELESLAKRVAGAPVVEVEAVDVDGESYVAAFTDGLFTKGTSVALVEIVGGEE
jgi:hypothetical protein